MSEQVNTVTGEIMEEGRFNPSRFLRKLDKGGDYLDVKWRIRWLRDLHPEAEMTSTIVQIDWESGYIVVHARVVIPGRGAADGIGSETRQNFPAGWVEKAETVAYGRALAALGFGTQFCFDFDTIDEAGNGKLADSPVGGSGSFGSSGQQGGSSNLATQAQLKLIYLTAEKDLHISVEELEENCQAQYGRLPLHLTKREASEFIEALKARAAANATTAPEPPRQPQSAPPKEDLADWAKRYVAQATFGPPVAMKGKNERTEALKAMMAHLRGAGIPEAQIGPLCERLHAIAGGEPPSESAPMSHLLDGRLIVAMRDADGAAQLMLKRLATSESKT